MTSILISIQILFIVEEQIVFKYKSFTESFYTESDLLNTPPDLQYGTVTESILLGQYDAINGLRSNKTSFALQSDSTPIFQKQFNPSDTSTLDASTGIFTIIDHFFETGERLIYDRVQLLKV